MSNVYTLDTNAIIYFLKDDERAVKVLQEIFTSKENIFISTISEIELLSFSKLQRGDVERIEKILSTLAIIPVDSHIARISAYIRRMYGIKLADSTIAATALFTGSILITRNIQDFREIRGLRVLRI